MKAKHVKNDLTETFLGESHQPLSVWILQFKFDINLKKTLSDFPQLSVYPCRNFFNFYRNLVNENQSQSVSQ